jgi:tryptophanyl-tRNA synthetase
MFLSFITPLSWLSRCPTFKEQVKQLKDKDVNTYSFLGYPVLQASDILLYKSDCVPVGEDQLPHLELCREIARRFHFIYKKEIFVEPKALLTKTPRLMGLDGRKMSKSYDNYIALDEQDKALEKKVLSMFTDPSRIKKEDKGHPDKCNVFSYYKMFLAKREKEAYKWCSQGQKGCVECKRILIASLKEFIGPRREKKQKLIKKKAYIYDILEEGKRRAKKIAAKTIASIKEVMSL